MPDITQMPALYLGFAALHMVMGQFGSAWIYRLRFGGSPLVIYRKGQTTGHMRVTRRLALPVVVWAVALCAYALSPTFRATWAGAPLVDLSPWWGWGVGLVGLIGMVSAQMNMGRSFRVGQDESPDAEPQLVRSGLYRWSRNPVYVFSFLYLAGVTLWAPCLAVAVPCAAIGAMMHRLVLEEETFLRARLGAPYIAYCARVRRYL